MSDLSDSLVKVAHEAIDGAPSDVFADGSSTGLASLVAVAVLRELAASTDDKPPREMVPAQVIRSALRSLADEIEGASGD